MMVIRISILMAISCVSFAQDSINHIVENQRTCRPFGVNVSIGGPTILASASVDAFILSVLNVEGGGGLEGFYGGATYHFKGNVDNKQGTVYSGIFLTYRTNSQEDSWPSGGDQISNSWIIKNNRTTFGTYIPIGFKKMYNNGCTLSYEIAYCNFASDFVGSPLWLSVKFGYHFSGYRK